MEHWFLYENLQDVARMYLRDTFFMDALGSLPGSPPLPPAGLPFCPTHPLPHTPFFSDSSFSAVALLPKLKLRPQKNAVQYLDCIPNTSAGQIKLLRLLRMIKLLRLNRLQQVLPALT